MTSRREVERQGEFESFPHQQLRPVGLEAVELVPLPPVGFARAHELGHRRSAIDQPLAKTQRLPPFIDAEAFARILAVRWRRTARIRANASASMNGGRRWVFKSG